MLKYALFTGCTAKESTPELLMSTMAVAEALGIELVTLTEATCCGASHLQDFDEFLSLVLNARNICYAESRGLDMVTICNTCQLNLAQTNDRLKADPELRARVNEKLAEVGLEFKGTCTIRHFLYVLRDDYGYAKISEKVTVPFSNFNIAAFYGCHNIRPGKTHAPVTNENAYVPTSLDELIKAVGGNAVDYEYKNSCCGFHVDLQAPHTAHKLTGRALLGAADGGADMVVTPCPLCHLKMDVQQRGASKEMGREIKIPVLHMPQIVGLALGIEPRKLGLQHHVTSPNFVDL